ncbi:MAG: DUF1092 family protein [Oscillatoriales cyanobacterium]|nr:MAG: DUF1092 family protein [Oscillatoriales cyanobacterium]
MAGDRVTPATISETVWEVDFYRRPRMDTTGQPLWELVVCDRARSFVFRDVCPQSLATADWLVDRLIAALGDPPQPPDWLCVFRPQSLSLIETAARQLGWPVEATRRTLALKDWLQRRAIESPLLDPATRQPYDPLAIDQPPPLPMPESLWGDRWQFVGLSAAELTNRLLPRPIPHGARPPELQPAALGLPPTTTIPGVAIEAARRSRLLAQWLDSVQPVALQMVAGQPNGLVLDAGLCDRWILTTFEDAEVQQAGQSFQQRKAASQGLHFLLVQPDDSGMTYSGLWLLQPV